MTHKTRSRIRLVVFGFCSIVMAARGVNAADGPLTAGARLAIVGDSITEQKLYSKYMECYVLACSGVPDLKVFQFGWGGETAGGFSARVENDLGVFKPSVVTLCYGMNDGSYQPFKDEIGAAYERNMRSVLAKLDAIGVKSVVVGSPGAVDTKFFGRRPSFGDRNAAEGYNDNLAHLRDIDRKLSGESKQLFADVHAAMVDSMKKAKAELGDDYDVCGRDGVHPGPNGQLIMAYAFLKALGCDGRIGEIVVDLKGSATATTGHRVLASTGGKAELESTRWPFCFDGDPKSPGGTRSMLAFLPFNEELNRLVLKVTHLDAAKAKVTWGDETKEFTREQLTAGVNLPAEFSHTPFDPAFQKFMNAVGAKQAFETYMIKSIVTQFRGLPAELKNDNELQSALTTVSKHLLAHQQRLDAEARALLVPVRHSVTIKATE